jgi:tetratricopeptide (TPR) repeat protein
MEENWASGAEPLIKDGRYQDALDLIGQQLEAEPGSWYLNYLAGQCERFCGNDEKALRYLAEADQRRGVDDPPLLLALAIAFQRLNRHAEAIATLRRSLEADPDHLPSINTLAMTQKLMGEPEKAAHNYDLALKKIARSLVDEMHNDRNAPIYKHEAWEEHYSGWLEYALDAAVVLGVRDGIDGIAWPTGEAATWEEATEEHGGLYWTDQLNDEDEIVRLFWPNFFTTFRERMTGHPMYADLVGNRSTVLRMLGEVEKADQLVGEARFFSSRR